MTWRWQCITVWPAAWLMFSTMVLTVTGQQDRFFSGRIVFKGKNGSEQFTDFAGVIGRDGRTFTMVEKGGGYSSGAVLAQDEIELTTMYDGTPYSIAVDSLKRV